MKNHLITILFSLFGLFNINSLLGQAHENNFYSKKYSLDINNAENKECNQFYELSKTASDTLKKIKHLRNSAKCYLANQLLKNVEILLNQAKILAIQSHNIHQEIKIDIELSNLFDKYSLHQETKDYLNRAEKNALLINDSNSLVMVDFNSATLYFKLENYDKALEYYNKGLKNKNIMDINTRGAFIQGIGSSYANQHKDSLSLIYYQKAVKLFIQIKSHQRLAHCYISMSQVYFKLTKYNLMLEKLDKGIQEIKLGNVSYLEPYVNEIKAEYLFAQGNYKQSIAFYEKAMMQAAEQTNIILYQNIILDKLKAHEKLLDYKNSYLLIKEYSKIKDSISNKRTLLKLELTEAHQYNNLVLKDNLDKKNKLLALELKNKTFRMTIIIITFILIIGILSFFLFRQNWKKNKLISELDLNHRLTTIENNKSKNKLNLEKSSQQNNDLLNELDAKNRYLNDSLLILKSYSSTLTELLSVKLIKEEKTLTHKIELILKSDAKVANINNEIELLNTSFYKIIQLKHPNLTDKEIKLASMLRSELSSKEVANILFISKTSVDVARSRLRKKLTINRETNLVNYLKSII